MRLPVSTLIALAMLLLFALLQWHFNGLLDALERDRAAIARGQVWRLATSLIVQDGGLSGTVFNLAALLLVGAVGEQLWAPRQWWLLAITGGILANFVGLSWQPVGAGNSIAVFALAGGIAVVPVTGSPLGRALSLLSAVLAVVLVGARDIHGAAAIFGAALASYLLTRTHPRST